MSRGSAGRAGGSSCCGYAAACRPCGRGRSPMRGVMYLYLPCWPIDRLRRLNDSRPGSVPPSLGGAPADEKPFATVVETGGRRLLAAVNPAAASAGLMPGMPLADPLSFLPALVTSPAKPQADAPALNRLAERCTPPTPVTHPHRLHTAPINP